jgi:2-polyprenyl-6-methoxyphenol hydroxylase-like FAD-dependent oxidoreductase
MIFCFSAEGLMLSIPMPGADDDGRACHFVWFRPIDETGLAALCTDAAGRLHGVSIPPPLIRPEVIGDLKARAQAEFAPQVAALVTRSPQLILQPIFDLETPRMVFARVALLGDAAFVARPHVATGVMKAALDAQCLTDALAGSRDLHDALADYEDKRSKFGRWLVERGRHIGAQLVAQPAGDASARRRHIDRIMREYGTAGAVADEAITARDFA